MTEFDRWVEDSQRTRRVDNETAKLNQLVEKDALSSPNFLNALQTAFNDAKIAWAPFGQHGIGEIIRGMATITGELTPIEPFRLMIDEEEYLILCGLKIHYSGSDICKIEITADGVICAPFVVDAFTQYVFFINCIIWRPERHFVMKMTGGTGRLQFRCVGATLYKGQYGYSSLAYTVPSERTTEEIKEDIKKEPIVDDPRIRGLFEE